MLWANNWLRPLLHCRRLWVSKRLLHHRHPLQRHSAAPLKPARRRWRPMRFPQLKMLLMHCKMRWPPPRQPLAYQRQGRPEPQAKVHRWDLRAVLLRAPPENTAAVPLEPA